MEIADAYDETHPIKKTNSRLICVMSEALFIPEFGSLEGGPLGFFAPTERMRGVNSQNPLHHRGAVRACFHRNAKNR
ncbi:hypothetical protein IMZ48_40705 [Candidatus Bathyarchaeota archaeon]|nr:hypothetical protein [Candidatus Bathyarchaeota archaeon]